MIISVEEARNLIDDFKGWSDDRIQRKLKAIEEFLEVMPKIFIDDGIQSENGVNENETK